MPTQPVYLQGEDLTLVTIQALAVASSGSVSNDGASLAVTAYVNRLQPGMEIQSTDTRPVNMVDENYVPHSRGRRLRLETLEPKDAPVVRAYLEAASTKRFYISWTLAGQSFGYYWTLQRVDGGIQSRDINPCTADFLPMYVA